MQLNYFGALKLIMTLLPSMAERGSGHIINISSIGVLTNAPRFSAYVASKAALEDRKSTRLNSSHVSISYSVFCLHKKNRIQQLLGYTSSLFYLYSCRT